MTQQLFTTFKWPCSKCDFTSVCGAMLTSQRCKSDAPSVSGGQHELTLTDPDLDQVIRDIGGFGFENVRLRPHHIDPLPQLLAQVRIDGRLEAIEPLTTVAVRIEHVIEGGRIVPAHEVRRRVNATVDARVLVIWFADDRFLERRDSEAGEILHQMRTAGFSAATTPSLATYSNRSRLDFMKNAKRSLNYAVAFERVGITPIPHIGLNVEYDVHRYAKWLNANPGIGTVSFDVGCEMKAGNDQTFPLAAELDVLTGFRLRYVVAGVGDSLQNILKVVRRLPSDRVSLTDASPATAKPEDGRTRAEQFDFELSRRSNQLALADALTSGPIDIRATASKAGSDFNRDTPNVTVARSRSITDLS